MRKKYWWSVKDKRQSQSTTSSLITLPPILRLEFSVLPDIFPEMEKTHILTLSLLTLLMIFPTDTSPVTSNSPAVSKYQIECTMCSACDNPCNKPVPPPSQPSPPPPSPPPPPSGPNCPPPPSTPSSGGGYYYAPPPPSYAYPPPTGFVGGYAPNPVIPYNPKYPRPPPPNPIVPYFPFYYYGPPPPSLSAASIFRGSGTYTVSLFVMILCFL